MIRGANGTGPMTVRISREKDFEAFDALPPEVRQALNYATFKYQAELIASQVARIGGERVAALMPAVDARTLQKEKEDAAARATAKRLLRA